MLASNYTQNLNRRTKAAHRVENRFCCIKGEKKGLMALMIGISIAAAAATTGTTGAMSGTAGTVRTADTLDTAFFCLANVQYSAA